MRIFPKYLHCMQTKTEIGLAVFDTVEICPASKNNAQLIKYGVDQEMKD